MIKPKRMSLVGHVAPKYEVRNTQKIPVAIPKEKHTLEL
jgi:hypothetical protein